MSRGFLFLYGVLRRPAFDGSKWSSCVWVMNRLSRFASFTPAYVHSAEISGPQSMRFFRQAESSFSFFRFRMQSCILTQQAFAERVWKSVCCACSKYLSVSSFMLSDMNPDEKQSFQMVGKLLCRSDHASTGFLFLKYTT